MKGGSCRLTLGPLTSVFPGSLFGESAWEATGAAVSCEEQISRRLLRTRLPPLLKGAYKGAGYAFHLFSTSARA